MITFGDGAEDVLVQVAQAIPEGYTVALLGEGQEPTEGPDCVLGVDVRVVTITADGVVYDYLDIDGTPTGTMSLRPWADIERIHVY